jgi:threo-3-hydroxy-L-aspartate ammonia-lyase
MIAATSSDVRTAVLRLSGIANRTPVVTSRTLDERVGARLILKCENFQRAGAFKFRGAYNAISQLSPAEREAGVITHSSGNHAQAIALSARLLGVRSVVVMPDDAPTVKRQATEGYGAEVVPCKALERDDVTRQLIDDHGYTLIHPYDNAAVIAGQGTAAWELLEDAPELDLLLVPVGGGGLISGSALAAAALAPHCRVVGCEPIGANDAGMSWRQGKVVTLDRVPDTIADGLRTRYVGRQNLAIMQRYVADMVVVSESEIVEALRFLWERLKLVIEPSAAVALAPLLSGQLPGKGRRIGVLLSGGNAEIELVARHLASFPTAASPVVGARASTTAKPRILVCVDLPEPALELLQQTGEVDLLETPLEDELLAVIDRYHAVVVGPSTRLSGQVIEYGFRLRVIVTVSSSPRNVDVSAARAQGIAVHYVPDGRAVSVAEHTVGLMLQLSESGPDAVAGEPKHQLAGRTLGLIGYGKVGRQVARRALAFEMAVLVNQPRLTPELALEEHLHSVDLPELLQQSNFISLHVPVKSETEALIGQRELALVKPGAYLINTVHTDLIGDEALIEALNSGRLAGAALARFPPEAPSSEARPSPGLMAHPAVLSARHISTFDSGERTGAVLETIRRAVEVLREQRPTESLSLAVVPVDQLAPHEAVDESRVVRLMERLRVDGRLMNPPLVAAWRGKYVVLDGATRHMALKRLGFDHVVAQVVSAEMGNFSLHTWYHVISGPAGPAVLLAELGKTAGLKLTSLAQSETRDALGRHASLCYFQARDGSCTLASLADGADPVGVMNEMVGRYMAWGRVERTLSTNLDILTGQFPELVAIAVYPQFVAENVFDLAVAGGRLPAGLTRFVVPGRVLRLNADLARLKSQEPLAAKRAWLEQFVHEKLARNRMRYYQEPVILLDE